MGASNTILCFQSDDMLVYEQQCYISIYHLSQWDLFPNIYTNLFFAYSDNAFQNYNGD